MRFTLRLFLAAAAATSLLAACSGTTNSAGGPVAGSALPQVDRAVQPAMKLQTLHVFQGPPDGGSPFGALLLGSDGNFFGTTNGGGTSPNENGTVFEVTPSGFERVLYTFQGGNDGAGAEAGLTQGTGGVLYGATDFGGGSAACSGGCGTVFDLVPNGSSYTEHVLYAFQGGADAANPLGNLLIDKNGNIFGTSYWGGGSQCTSQSTVMGCGTVYELSPNGPGYTEKVLYGFKGGNDGQFPTSSLFEDSAGRLYGTTEAGGGTSGCLASLGGGCGTAFRVTQAGHETVLYRFQGGNDGSIPRSALLSLKGAQQLVGTTLQGGSSGCGGTGCGTVFELTLNAQTYGEKVLYRFSATGGDGIHPSNQNGLVTDRNGDLFGTTGNGGSSNCYCGTVFELSPSGSGYSEHVVHSMVYPQGTELHASLTTGPGGLLYGVAFNGGHRGTGCRGGCGTVFRVTP
jgi:uncharacterized repeat protein (TIGR03803 family)